MKPKPPDVVQTDCPWCGSAGLVCENPACPKRSVLIFSEEIEECRIQNRLSFWNTPPTYGKIKRIRHGKIKRKKYA